MCKCDEKEVTHIFDYQGYSIFLQEGDGFYWSNRAGTFAGQGFFENVKETMRSIEDYNLAEREAFPEFYEHDDSPSLPDRYPY